MRIYNSNIDINNIEIKYLESNDFLNQWHYQGSDNNGINICALYEQEILASINIDFNENEIVINRFAKSANIKTSILFQKMINWCINVNNFKGKLIFKSNNQYNDNIFLRECGFSIIEEQMPTYQYFKNANILIGNIDKSYVIEKFNLNYADSLEDVYSIMKSNGYDRFWNAGCCVWETSIT